MNYTFTYRKKNQGWQVILSYKDSLGRWHQKSKQGFPSHDAAKLGGDDLLDELKKTAMLDTSSPMASITLAAFCEVFISDSAPRIRGGDPKLLKALNAKG